MVQQAQQLARRPHIIIATPGRLAKHINHSPGAVHLSRVRFLVLDEADRLLSPTFSGDLETILGCLPKQRQTLLFTATMTDAILALRDTSEKKPFVHLCDMSVSTVSTLDQFYVFVPSHVQAVYLAHITQMEEFKNKSMIIFCGRCSTAEYVQVMLTELGITCTGLHSGMSQRERLESLEKFRAEVVKILISTDVGSR